MAVSQEDVRRITYEMIKMIPRIVYSNIPVLREIPIATLASHPPEGASYNQSRLIERYGQVCSLFLV
jgi:hypothetical protein